MLLRPIAALSGIYDAAIGLFLLLAADRFAALFGVSIWSATQLPTSFMPAENADRIVIALQLPPGTTLDQTRAATDRVAVLIKSTIPEARSVFTKGGTTPTGQGREARKAALVVTLPPKGERERTQKQVEADIAAHLANHAVGLISLQMHLVHGVAR